MIEDAISHYHALLTQPMLDDAQAKLAAGIERYNLKFGTRPICNVLRPLFVSARQYEYIKRESALVLSAIEKLGHHLLQNDALRATLDLTPLEEQAIQIEPGFPAPDVSGRLDAFLNSHDDFSFVEYNADSPGGLLYGDVLGEVFAEMQIVQAFQRRFPLRRIAIRPQLLRQMMLNYQLFGWWEHPRIAIVDWEGAATHAEFELCRQYFEEKGYSTIIADPRQLEYRGGWLRVGDFKINLVYKRVLVSELLEREGLQTPLIRAMRERAVCVMNSLRVQMLTKKMIFALLDDPVNERLFTVEEISALRRHVPWTRKLRDGKTTYCGRKIELLEHLGQHRERMVLKPNSEYGGRGVVLGWECSDSEWHQAVRDALNKSAVVQERVEVTRQTFPVINSDGHDDEVLAEERYVDFDPYTWSGEHVEGAGVRLSSDALLNVSAGGGSATPLMVIERDAHSRW